MCPSKEGAEKKAPPESVVRIAMDHLDCDALPTVDEVCSFVDQHLSIQVYAHLRPQRAVIVDDILRRLNVRIGDAVVMDGDGEHQDWLPSADRSNWHLWPRLAEFLRQEEDLPPAVLQELDESTDKTLARLESPERLGTWDRRGLVVGHVQSGKTTHYTALAAKALDSGYQVVIVLAGVHNSLRSQTHERFDKHLIGRDSAALLDAIRTGKNPAGASLLGVGQAARRRGDPDLPFSTLVFTSANEDGDFNRKVAGQIQVTPGPTTRLVLVVKKNAVILRQLASWLMTLGTGAGRQGVVTAPTLVIDDEADYASLNTRDLGAEPSTINKLIRQILVSVERVAFVGYTATPFANIFVRTEGDDEPGILGPDLFPRSFIVNLQAPSDYVGPEAVFGHPGDESVGLPERLPLPMHVPLDDTEGWLPDKHKKDHKLGPLPASLITALRLFVVNCATRDARGQARQHSSMLIHVTRFINVQDRVAALVSRMLETERHVLEYGAGPARGDLETAYRRVWQEHIAAGHSSFVERFGRECPRLPEWPDVWSRVLGAFARIKVVQINGQSEDSLAYARTVDGRWVVAIGGDKLSRGLTLSGLSVSYFLRASNMFDTLMQMGRWFGYRPGYVDLCRVFTTRPLMSAFREIALAMEDLRSDFDRMAAAGLTPESFGLRVRTPPDGLVITAANKIRDGDQIGVRFARELVNVLEVQQVGPTAERNQESLRRLFARLGEPRREVRGRKTSHFLWRTSAEAVLDFLSGYEAFSTPSFFAQCDALRRYIGQQMGHDELVDWTVALVSQGLTDDPHPVQVGAFRVPRVARSPLSKPGAERFATQALVGKADEGLDLSESEFANALERSRPTRSGDAPSVPDRDQMRSVRSARNGLLLVYLVMTSTDYEHPGYVPAIAISFPDSTTAQPLSYTVNATWRREHGLLPDDEHE